MKISLNNSMVTGISVEDGKTVESKSVAYADGKAYMRNGIGRIVEVIKVSPIKFDGRIVRAPA